MKLEDLKDKCKEALIVLGGCHTLAMADNNLVGDPIEKQAFEGINFQQSGNKTSIPKVGNYPKITQYKRFMFESALKRQSAIINVNDGIIRGGINRVVCKGAPEVVEKFIKDLPEGYRDSYIHYVKNGARVLVMAYKDIKTSAE